MDNFLTWLGLKIYGKSDTFKNIIYGIYYNDVLVPELQKIDALTSENIVLKSKLNVYEGQSIVAEPEQEQEVKIKRKRKYTKRKKEVKE